MSPFFTPSGVSLVAGKRLATHKGCQFHRATPEEADTVYPELTDEIKEDILIALEEQTQEKPFKEETLAEHQHIIGTVCKGRFTGTQFSFPKLKDAPLFFNMANVSRVINNLITSYRGCTFRKATYEEAKPFRNNFTDEVLDDLKMMFQHNSHIWAIPLKGKYKGVRFFLNDKRETQLFFSPQSIYKILLGINESHLGFTFKAFNPKTDSEYQKQVLTKDIFYAVQSTLDVCFICTFTEWPFKGIEVGFTDRRLANRCFNMRSVSRVLNGQLTRYKRCMFRKVTYEEAAERADNITPDIIDYLS